MDSQPDQASGSQSDLFGLLGPCRHAPRHPEAWADPQELPARLRAQLGRRVGAAPRAAQWVQAVPPGPILARVVGGAREEDDCRLDFAVVIILGINDNHDSGAALCIDGELVAAVGQERIDRTKNSGAFPWDAIEEVLFIGGVKPADVDRIAFGSHFTPATALRRLPKFHHGTKSQSSQFSGLLNAYISYQVFVKESGLWPLEADLSRRFLHQKLRVRGLRAPVITLEHHSAHAYSAYRSQPYPDALVFTIDAMGDGTSVTVYFCYLCVLKPI